MSSTAPVDPVSAAVNAAIGRVGPGLYGVACSGGADSMTLAHATIAAAGAAHVVVISIDHRLQPGSGAVADGVLAWATDQGATAVVRGVDVEPRASIEAAARDARYAALDAIADELGLAVVFLGHTARDQAETVLMRIVRGTGPAGLAGIPARRARFVRPLLALPRAAIDDYVTAHALPIAADPMNDDLRLARVRMRAEILPALRRENPQLDAALVRLAASTTEWLEVIDGAAARWSQFPIDCASLAPQPAAIRKRAVAKALEALGVEHDATHLEDVDRLVCRSAAGEVGLDLPGLRLVRSYDSLAPQIGEEVGADKTAADPLGASGVSPSDDLYAPAGHSVRKWQPGDRMRPARLRGKSRKLSDLFIDAKVPRAQRAAARVCVRTSDGEIVWAEHLGVADGEGPEVVPKPA
jgi:tRNA(Ile)-lysidine synthase